MFAMTKHGIFARSRSSTSKVLCFIHNREDVLKSSDIVRKILSFDNNIEIFYLALSNTHIHETIQ